MAQSINRREFMTASAGIAASLGFGAASTGAQTPERRPRSLPPPVSSLDFKTKPHKALIAGPTEDDLKRMKDAGFEGVEGRVMPPDEAAKMREVADKLGMRIHSVLYGWAEFNSPDKGSRSHVRRDRGRSAHGAGVRRRDRAARPVPHRQPRRARGSSGRGASAAHAAVVGVPDRVRPANGHITKVVYGDNAPYADYIKAHNHATDTSREWVKRLIPIAEKTGVVIALENVSNNLWVSRRSSGTSSSRSRVRGSRRTTTSATMCASPRPRSGSSRSATSSRRFT